MSVRRFVGVVGAYGLVMALAACDGGKPATPGTTDGGTAKPPEPPKPVVFFERTVEVDRRATATYEFDCTVACTMVVQVRPDDTVYVTLEDGGGTRLLNEFKIVSGGELNKEVQAEKTGKYTLRIKNSNLVERKRVTVKIFQR